MSRAGWQDVPVASISEDLFNLSTYVNGLCSFIRNCETPMTISIQGDWGSGKTSMMNMLKENLKATIYPIWFNTWQFSQFDMGNNLIFSMMEVLLNELDCADDVKQRIVNGLKNFGIKAVSIATERITSSGQMGELASDILSGGPTDYASEVLKLKQRFQEAINAKLKTENRDRVVIFVDDLDRLQPVKAVELLEVLKLFLDCDKCIFILAVDYEVVSLGIRQKFGSDVAEEKGRSFFDKIIQLPFKMPVAQYDIRKYLTEMMEHLDISTEEKEVSLFYNLIKTSCGFNPRSMKRLFNTYELLDIITRSTVRGISSEVRKRELFAIVCTQMYYEKLYLYLASTPIEEDTFQDFYKQDTCLDALKEIYSDYEDDRLSEQVRKVMSFMPFFTDALQVDDDSTLSEDELQNLRVILKCSVVTSIAATTEEDENSVSWTYRSRNKEIVQGTNALLTDIGPFSVWLPRKRRKQEEDEGRLSDAAGKYSWPTRAGFKCELEYHLSRVDDFTIDVSIIISEPTGAKGAAKRFFDTLGDNPLKLRIMPVREENCYRYESMLRLNSSDAYGPQQISSIVHNAYQSLTAMLPND